MAYAYSLCSDDTAILKSLTNIKLASITKAKGPWLVVIYVANFYYRPISLYTI